MLCPQCKAESARRSPRHGAFERLASIVRYYPYRCPKCKHRFLHSRSADIEAPSLEHKSTEREIRATQNVKTWRRKRRDLFIYGTALLIFIVFLYFITREELRPSDGAEMRPSSASERS